MHAPVTRPKLERFQRLLDEAKRRQAKKEQSEYGKEDENGVRQGGLIAFVRYFWPILEPETPFVDGWPLWAMCLHLEAVTAGKLTRLLMNVPPGSMKSLLVNVFWPAWEWGPMGKSSHRFVTFSYSASLTERDNGKFRDLVTSQPYQALYGSGPKGVRLRNKTTLKVYNTRTGWKLASSVGGVGTGERGDRIILDDPHNVKDAESETVRGETVRWFRESLSSRFNNEETAFVIIMQRVHEDDVSGVILSLGLDYCHLMIPMEYEWERQTDGDGEPVATPVVEWVDPRYVPAAPDECNGVLAWEERFSADAVERLKREIGPYGYAGQYQQRPAPRGGGIFKRDWWQLWAPDNKKFPVFDYLVASLDSAFTEKEQNDPSGMTVWGIFQHPEIKKPRIMLVHAWRKHLEFSGPRFERLPTEILTPNMPQELIDNRNARYLARTQPHWGLVEWVRHTCKEFKAHNLLIEAKASGMSAAQELRNRYGDESYAIQTWPVKGDKIARAYASQPTFSNELVYAPDRKWADLVISEMEVFPKGKYKDLTDSTTQAIMHIRLMGLAQTDEETTSAEMQTVMHRPRKVGALYPV
jgi:predicted phage terminase large subunit-like protein